MACSTHLLKQKKQPHKTILRTLYIDLSGIFVNSPEGPRSYSWFIGSWRKEKSLILGCRGDRDVKGMRRWVWGFYRQLPQPETMLQMHTGIALFKTTEEGCACSGLFFGFGYLIIDCGFDFSNSSNYVELDTDQVLWGFYWWSPSIRIL